MTHEPEQDVDVWDQLGPAEEVLVEQLQEIEQEEPDEFDLPDNLYSELADDEVVDGEIETPADGEIA